MKTKSPTKSRKNPKSLANLKPPFQKGNKQARGHGRPKTDETERAFQTANKEYLMNLVSEGRYTQALDAILKVQVKQGRIDLIKFLWESVNGKPPQPITPIEPIDIRFIEVESGFQKVVDELLMKRANGTKIRREDESQ